MTKETLEKDFYQTQIKHTADDVINFLISGTSFSMSAALFIFFFNTTFSIKCAILSLVHPALFVSEVRLEKPDVTAGI